MHKLIPLTVDAVVLNKDKVLLVKRARSPFKDQWALPGGFVDYGEKTEKACLRELKEETSIDGKIERLVGVYSDPKRDPRGHTISIGYLVKYLEGTPKAHDDAKEVRWFLVNDLPKLAFDHKDIIKDALQTGRSKTR